MVSKKSRSPLSFSKMVAAKFVAIFILMELIMSGFRFRAVDGFSMDYYIMTCPLADIIVKNTVNRALENDPTLAAALVRMHFHDCFIEVLLLKTVFLFHFLFFLDLDNSHIFFFFLVWVV